MTNIGFEVLLTGGTKKDPATRSERSRCDSLSSVRRGSERVALPGYFKKIQRLWIFLCILAMPIVVHAQNNKASWENLSGLAPGHKIQVVEMNSKKVSGTFVSVSGTAISLQDPGGQQTVQRTDVRIVKLMENHHRLRNAAIGAAVGAGVGAGIGAGVGASEGGCKSHESFCIDPIGTAGVAGIVAAAGAAVGAIVGALWPSHVTLYRADRK